MCVFSKPKTPATPKPPDPAPTPVAEQKAETTVDERRLKLERMRRGLASTIKTSAQGLGAGSDTTSNTLYGKTKLGQ